MPDDDPDKTQVDLGPDQGVAEDLGATHMDVETSEHAPDPNLTMMPLTDRMPVVRADPDQTMMPMTGRMPVLGDSAVVADPEQTMMPITGRLENRSADLDDPERTRLGDSHTTRAAAAMVPADAGELAAKKALIAQQEARLASQDELVRELAAQVTGLQDELREAREELQGAQADAERGAARKLKAMEEDVVAFEAETTRSERLVQVLEEKVKQLHGRRDTLAILLFVAIFLAIVTHLLR